MKWLGSGMQARFLLAMGGAMVVVVAILAVLLGRQTAMQSEVRTLSGGVIHELFDRSVRSRGEAMARELSDALANPLYYRDLDQVGVLVRSTARQPVVRYVLVFDERGRLVHDGSVEVLGFGQPMADPLAPKAAAAQALLVQESPKVLDNTMPIMVGNQRIGGVRVGMALDEVQQREQAANATLGERLQLVGSRHLGWLLLMLGLLVVIGVVVILYVQRTLVAPIRDLAAAARRIEAGDYQTPLAENTRDDEVGELVRGFARMRDRRMVGVEVLLRWQHPTLGTIPPSVFIEVAEQSGLIEIIGPKVLRAACMEASQWPRGVAGDDLFVSVNVSPRQLRGGELPALVAQCLHESGLPASRLHLELTETAVIGDEMVAAQLLDKLHRTGVKVWLDDFGTGFSGLSHLRQVPVDGVKIDKSFVADMQRDPDDLALTTAIIAMAHALGITVVAEGIEQQAQFELLAQRGCDLGQGYWLSHPVTATEVVRMIESGV